jgi:hypothetical protein
MEATGFVLYQKGSELGTEALLCLSRGENFLDVNLMSSDQAHASDELAALQAHILIDNA